MSKGKDYKIEILMKTVKNREAIETSLRPMLQSAIGISKNNPEIKDIVQSTIDKYLNDTIPSTIRQLIDNFFSEDDLDSCIAFFSSESGKKLLNAEYQQKNQNALMDVSRDMQKELLEILQPYLPKTDEARKENIKITPPANEL